MTVKNGLNLNLSEVVLAVKEFACQCKRCKRHRFDFWVMIIPENEMATHTSDACLKNPVDRRAW